MRRLATAVLVLVGAALGQACLADGADGEQDGQTPILRFHADPTDPAYGSVDLQRLSAAMIRRLRHVDPSVAQWQRIFPVIVNDADWAADGALPPVLGRYELLPDRVRFTPRFPPTKGLRYLARADLSVVLGDLGHFSPLTLDFSLPNAAMVPATVVDNVFPSGDALPENLLRFYVYFSAPMQRGSAKNHIVLLGPDGKPAEATFFNLAFELWDPAMRRLTLLLDPGRIKRGVGLNTQLGAPLQQGLHYTLMIDNGMTDATGRPLRSGFSKSFRVTAAIRTPIDPRQWTIDLPAAGTRQALELKFPAPLDQALLSRTIRVVDPDQQFVAGHIEIDQQETQWSFTPSSAWVAGSYQLSLDASLEDVSGNTSWAPFDADIRSEVAAENRLALPFVPFLASTRVRSLNH